MHLVTKDFLKHKFDLEAIKKGFGKGLLAAGKQNEQVVAACADLTGSTAMNLFAEDFPERFVEVGIAEQNLVTVGSGLAAMGKIPFVSSYAAFSPGRNWEQIRTTICLNDQTVHVVGSHAGLYTGADGATHQMLEDIALTRVLPNMTVIAPADSIEAEKAVLALSEYKSPSYLRLTREPTPIFTTKETPFEIGKAYVYKDGKDVTLIATGTMTINTLMAADILANHGIDAEVIHLPTIKPLDEGTILNSVKKTNRVVTVEEAQIQAGMGSAICELLAEEMPTKVLRIGVKDKFGQTGQPADLLEHYGLTPNHIALKIHQVL
ncbi:transketolase family protein [Candidatus Saccharibacteria bacterium]|nr:transketolase family protein [Candidatus Saccharibacteria bacterium]